MSYLDTTPVLALYCFSCDYSPPAVTLHPLVVISQDLSRYNLPKRFESCKLKIYAMLNWCWQEICCLIAHYNTSCDECKTFCQAEKNIRCFQTRWWEVWSILSVCCWIYFAFAFCCGFPWTTERHPCLITILGATYCVYFISKCTCCESMDMLFMWF